MSITDKIKKNKKNIFIFTVGIIVFAILFRFIVRISDRLDFLVKPAETNFISEATEDSCVSRAITETIKKGYILLNMDVELAKMNCRDISNAKKTKEEKEEKAKARELLYMSQKNAIKENN